MNHRDIFCLVCKTIVSSFAGILVFIPLTSIAQNNVLSGKRPIRYEAYADVWECNSAVQRVRDSVRSADPVWRDTIPWAQNEETYSFPDIATQVAKRCGSSTPIADERAGYAWLQLLLARNDSAGALLLAESILRETPGTSEDIAARALQIFQIYAEFWERPLVPLDHVTTWLQKHEFTVAEQIKIWGRYLAAAKARRNDALTKTIGGTIVELTKKLDGEDASAADGSVLRSAIFSGLRARYEREFYDSLRTGGVAAFKRALAAAYRDAEASGWLAGSGWFDAGTPAHPVQAVQWFPSAPESPVPIQGKVSLLIFLDNMSHTGGIGNVESFDFFYTLRRIKQRFPDLDVTIVSRSLGWFWHGPPLSVRQEGDVIQRWLLETRALPARVGIDSTPWYRIPGLDRRRVNMPSENDVNYQLGAANANSSSSNRLKDGEYAILISRGGSIIKTGRLRRVAETAFSDLIDILLKRETD